MFATNQPEQDSDNSAKRAFLRDFITALIQQNTPFLMKHVSQDFQLYIPGADKITGKAHFEEALEANVFGDTKSIKLEGVIVDGDKGASWGNGVSHARGGGFAFSSIIELSQTEPETVVKVTTFLMPTSEVLETKGS